MRSGRADDFGSGGEQTQGSRLPGVVYSLDFELAAVTGGLFYFFAVFADSANHWVNFILVLPPDTSPYSVSSSSILLSASFTRSSGEGVLLVVSSAMTV